MDALDFAFDDFLFDLSFIDPSRLGFNGGVGR